MQDLETIVARALAELAAAGDAASLENTKARYLGKSGELTVRLRSLGKLSTEERRGAGQAINAAKERLETALERRRAELAQARMEAKLTGEALDVTLPGRGRSRGGLHPITPMVPSTATVWLFSSSTVSPGRPQRTTSPPSTLPRSKMCDGRPSSSIT